MAKQSCSPGQKELINKFAKHGIDGLLDREALELFLYYAIPGKDAGAQADALIEAFGDARRVIDAPLNELVSVPGMDVKAATLVKLLKEFSSLYLKKRVEKKRVYNVWLEMIKYLQLSMAGLKNEQFRVVFLCDRDVLIDVETLQDGTVDQSVVYPRKVIERALYHNATSLVFAHNHPNGNPHPSEADIDLTMHLVAAASSIDIEVLDHIIIGRTDFFSFQDAGLLEYGRAYPEVTTVNALSKVNRRLTE